MKRMFWIPFVIVLIACAAPSPTQTIIIPTSTQKIISSSPWIQKHDMPSARSEMPAIELNGLIYVVGGFGPLPKGGANGYDAVNTFEAYNPKTDTWIALAPTPEARNHSMMTAYKDRIYVFGGYAGEWKVYSNAWMYDTVSDKWTILDPMPAPRTSGGAVTIGDYIYLVGGITSQAHVIVPNWRYDPETNSWEEIAPLLQPREHVDAVALNGLVYVLAGRWIGSLNTVEIYDPAKDQWTEGIPMKNERGGFGATVMNGKIYVAGGELIEDGKTVKSVEVFDPTAQAWSSLPDLPGGLHGVPLVGFENTLYIIGGSGRAADMINWGRVFAYKP